MALRAGSLLEASTVADLDDVGEVAVSEVWNLVWEILPLEANRELSLQYLPPYNPGAHKLTIDIDTLAEGLSGIYDTTPKITDLYITFYAFDAFGYSPREEIVRIPFVLGTAPEFGVLNPPAGSQVICPSTPRFSWIYNDASANSVGIWLEKGEIIKGKVDHDREYSTSTHRLITEYTPVLDDGRYSFRIGVSREGEDKEFTNPSISTRSNTYHFTVDPTLVNENGECFSVPATPSDRQTAQVDDGIDGGVVPRSSLPGVYDQLTDENIYNETDTGLVLTNDSEKDICVVRAKSLLENNSGENLLEDNKKLKKGDTQFFPVAPGSYDVILEDCDNTTIYNHNGSVDIEPGNRKNLEFSSSTITLQVENHSIEPICELDVLRTKSNDLHRFGFSSPIEPSGGLYVTLEEEPGQFDLKLIDCEGESLTEEDSVYISNQYTIKALPLSGGDIAPRIEKDATSTTISIKEALVQSLIHQQFGELLVEMKDFVEFKSTPEVVFEDGAILMRGQVSIQGSPTVTGYIEVDLYVNSAGVVQVDDVKVIAGGVNIPINSFQEAKTLINEGFQEVFASMFIERGIKELVIDNGVIIVKALPVCTSGNSGSGKCIPMDLYNEFLSGIEMLIGKPATIIDVSSCVEIPNVVGRLSLEASNQLSQLGFGVQRFRSDDDNVITSQQPKAGTCHQKPQLVTVSLQELPVGKLDCVDIPDFSGKSYSVVQDWSKENGFKFVRDNDPYQASKPTGIVLRQNPPPGYCVHPNDSYMYVWLNQSGGQ